MKCLKLECLTSVGYFGRDLEQHMILYAAMRRASIFHCAVGVGPSDFGSHRDLSD